MSIESSDVTLADERPPIRACARIGDQARPVHCPARWEASPAFTGSPYFVHKYRRKDRPNGAIIC